MGTGQVLNPVRAVGIERKEGRGRGHSRKRAGDWPGRSGDTVKRELLVNHSANTTKHLAHARDLT